MLLSLVGLGGSGSRAYRVSISVSIASQCLTVGTRLRHRGSLLGLFILDPNILGL